MKTNEIRKKTQDDLEKLLSELRESVRGLRFKVAAKEIKNYEILRQTRKDIARILTILKEKSHENPR